MGLSVKTTVPAKSSGRLVDAITDIIRPITERLGLKGDLIRLQREEVALQVAELAMMRIALEKRPVSPVPLKAIVPLFEQASLEDASDSTMINMWANLLASAAMGAQRNVPRYVSILSELNGQQARLIQRIMTQGRRRPAKINADLLLESLWSIDQAGILLRLKQEVSDATPTKIAKIVKSHIIHPGVAVSDIIINQGEKQWDSVKGLFPADDNQVDIEILESLNLLKDATFKDTAFLNYELS
jgi:hypothetical protein